MHSKITIGFARIHKEPGERRDFLPSFIARLVSYGAQISLEYGYGSGMNLLDQDYQRAAPGIQFCSRYEIYQHDYVVVLRYTSDDEVSQMRSGSCLISMLHYPTRPQRVEFLRSLGLEAISLDSIKDDSNRRMVENLRAVAWNGIEAAFKVLRSTYPAPGFGSPARPPIRVTLIGAGAVGSQVIPAAIRYGDEDIRSRMVAGKIPGVIVTTIDYDITMYADYMRQILSQTDILVDATQRPDPSQPVIPNAWVANLPTHAVLLDLSVDPYDCGGSKVSVKGIEGIPQGNLDQYIFAPDDPVYSRMPDCIDTTHRRYAVSCYSWPGIYPRRCMDLYGRQLRPLMRALIEKGGVQNINPSGSFFERALSRAMLSRWGTNDNNNQHG
jgi:alanine dehydrogenase